MGEENLPAPNHIIMITIYIKKCNTISQKIYDDTINRLQLALHLSVIVPYSQVMLQDQQDILNAHQSAKPVETILERNLLIDENTVKYIIRQYRIHWKERLAALGLSLLDELIIPCFADYSRQFMQIRHTPNILYS